MKVLKIFTFHQPSCSVLFTTSRISPTCSQTQSHHTTLCCRLHSHPLHVYNYLNVQLIFLFRFVLKYDLCPLRSWFLGWRGCRGFGCRHSRRERQRRGGNRACMCGRNSTDVIHGAALGGRGVFFSSGLMGGGSSFLTGGGI